MDWGQVKVRELDQPRRKTEPFAILPLAQAAKAAAATNCHRLMVWIWLVQQVRKTRAAAVAVSNEALAKYGVGRKAKRLALRQLEAAGLIAVVRHKGKTPVVKLLL